MSAGCYYPSTDSHVLLVMCMHELVLLPPYTLDAARTCIHIHIWDPQRTAPINNTGKVSSFPTCRGLSPWAFVHGLTNSCGALRLAQAKYWHFFHPRPIWSPLTDQYIHPCVNRTDRAIMPHSLCSRATLHPSAHQQHALHLTPFLIQFPPVLDSRYAFVLVGLLYRPLWMDGRRRRVGRRSHTFL